MEQIRWQYQLCVLRRLCCVWLFVTSWWAMWPTRLLCPWNFSGKNTGVGCHFLLQRIFRIQGLNPCLLHFLPCSWFFTAEPRGKPRSTHVPSFISWATHKARPWAKAKPGASLCIFNSILWKDNSSWQCKAIAHLSHPWLPISLRAETCLPMCLSLPSLAS